MFYIFNLSPHDLFNNGKFWFFISNTIILIIAADYGAFYFSKDNKLALYDEFVLQNQTKNMAASFVSPYSEIAREKVQKVDEKHQNGDVLENNDSVVKTNTKENDNGVCEEKGVIEEKTFRCTKSDVVEKIEEEKKNCILERSDSEYYGDNGLEREENNEYMSMSDAELNRRVEEFIQRLHRQIRLQGLLEAAEST